MAGEGGGGGGGGSTHTSLAFHRGGEQIPFTGPGQLLAQLLTSKLAGKSLLQFIKSNVCVGEVGAIRHWIFTFTERLERLFCATHPNQSNSIN